MSLSKGQQDRLEAALADRATKEALLDEMQAMRDAFNALLVKMDGDAGIGDTDYESELEIEEIREGGKKTRL